MFQLNFDPGLLYSQDLMNMIVMQDVSTYRFAVHQITTLACSVAKFLKQVQYDGFEYF